MKVLAVMCHPDDMELCCGGTLIKYRKMGHEVFVCNVANGNMGHVVIMPDELRKIRLAEAEKSCSLGGFTYIPMDVGDLTVDSSDKEQVKKLIKIIRDVAPDVIITHSPDDYCSDHLETAKLVFKASFDASCPHFMSELGEAVSVTPVFYSDTDRGMNFIPTEYVDITDEMDLKEEMLKCHESQLKWLSDHDGIDAVSDMRKHAESRGSECEVKYAEGFRPLIASQRMRTYRLLP